MDEKRLKQKVKDALTPLGWVMATHDPSRRGVPDITAIVDGRAFWWELKYAPGGGTLPHPVSAPQSKMLRDQADAGAHAGVLVGTGCGEGFFVPAAQLTPGPEKSLEGTPKPIDVLVEELCG